MVSTSLLVGKVNLYLPFVRFTALPQYKPCAFQAPWAPHGYPAIGNMLALSNVFYRHAAKLLSTSEMQSCRSRGGRAGSRRSEQ